MTTFNYRVIRFDLGDGDAEYRVYETYYNDEGDVAGTVTRPSAVGNDMDDLRLELEHMLASLDKPVLENEKLVRDYEKRKTERDTQDNIPWDRSPERNKLMALVYPNKEAPFPPEKQAKIDADLETIWKAANRIWAESLVLPWLEGFNYYLNTRPIDAIFYGRIQDVLDEIARVEQGAY